MNNLKQSCLTASPSNKEKQKQNNLHYLVKSQQIRKAFNKLQKCTTGVHSPVQINTDISTPSSGSYEHDSS